MDIRFCQHHIWQKPTLPCYSAMQLFSSGFSRKQSPEAEFASRWFIWKPQVAEVQDMGSETKKQSKPIQGHVIKLATAIGNWCSVLLRSLTKWNSPAWEQKEESFLHWVLHWPRLTSWVFSPLYLQILSVWVLCALAL